MNTSKNKIRFPIVFKLVFLTSLLIIAVSVILANQNTKLFEQISTDREEATAEILTSSKALEVEAVIESYVEKLTSIASNSEKNKILPADFLYFKLESVDQNANQFELINENEKNYTMEDFRKIQQAYSSFANQVISGGVFLTNTAGESKEPYLFLGAPVAKENGSVTYWAWGIMKLDRIQSSFKKANNYTVYLLDQRGKVLVHPNERLTLEAKDMSDKKIVSQMLKEEIRQKQQYADNHLFSTSKTMFGPLVVGEVSQLTILAPSKLAKETTYFILGIVLSISFFLSVTFSQTLSSNLEKLTVFTRRIASGDFELTATKEIKSKDEIGFLATAFDEMTIGLKERDKIKTMFTKFHGTAVTEQLMNQEDMRRGKNCEAVIFFSDIRGFTDFSNDKTPEEVVSMLNSYFEVMVGIITKHGGVVDKFVGDAIMAVWGAPQGTENDSKLAVTACLEMRKALEGLNQTRIEEGHTPIKMGMGLHAGKVVAGTVGSNDRLEYTVIGDTVNTASRIESSTKSFGTDLLISEEVARRIGDDFLITFAGSTKVKGKDEPLKLAKVEGYYDEEGLPCIIATAYSEYEAEESEKVKVVA